MKKIATITTIICTVLFALMSFMFIVPKVSRVTQNLGINLFYNFLFFYSLPAILWFVYYVRQNKKIRRDQNGDDEFFAERFKEIAETYGTLVDSSTRKAYDNIKSSNSGGSGQNGTNFTPEIEYFRSDKQSFEYQEEVTFFWKTINADNVVLMPFGTVPPIGQKTYRIKDFKNATLTFELVAENSNIGRKTSSHLKLSNKTYKELYGFFKEQIKNEQQGKPDDPQKPQGKPNDSEDLDTIWFNVILVVFIGVVFLLIAIAIYYS